VVDVEWQAILHRHSEMHAVKEGAENTRRDNHLFKSMLGRLESREEFSKKILNISVIMSEDGFGYSSHQRYQICTPTIHRVFTSHPK